MSFTISSEQPRILIVRLSAIGDCVQTAPLAAALRERFPRAHLSWAVEPAAGSLVRTFRAVDEVIVVPKRFAHSLKHVWHLRKELRARRFDLTLDPQGLSKSGLVAWLSGAPRRIGLAPPAGREVNFWFQTELVQSRSVHMVDRYLDLLRPLGAEPATPRFDLQISPESAARADEIAGQLGLHGGYAVVNPGAGWSSKLWPVERFAAVARHIAQRGMDCLVVWGGPREQAWAEEIVRLADCPRVQMSPDTSLPQLAAILARAELFIGSDTGPLHLAAAFGTPCIGLFGASLGTAAGPYGPGHIVLQAAVDMSRGRKRPGADNWAMRRISVEDVVEACEAQLGRARVVA